VESPEAFATGGVVECKAIGLVGGVGLGAFLVAGGEAEESVERAGGEVSEPVACLGFALLIVGLERLIAAGGQAGLAYELLAAGELSPECVEGVGVSGVEGVAGE
jgi:hypothetical protein